jgi:hypothetical protein
MPFVDRYNIRDTRAATVVQEFKIVRDPDGLEIALDFGRNFGGMAFTCDELSASVRNTRAVAKADGWDYFDAADGQPVDFYTPFRPALRGV